MEDLIKGMSGTGIISTRNWLYTGVDQYKAFWSNKWRLITDKQLISGGLRSNDRWGVVALCGDEVVLVIPGCEVLGFMSCLIKPITTAVCILE